MDGGRPFRLPDGWGVTLEPPDQTIAEALGDAAVYVLDENEADWPALLDILLVCANLEPWLRSIVKGLHQRKRQEAKRRYAALYGPNDTIAFEVFMHRIVVGACDLGAEPEAGKR
ncbi:hypothetical protein [Caballeronia glebae]|uniref:hypothetical protein n=1 Tax=Caballeronia glebae TaxID=1777143 RepID=UPI0038BCB7DE